MGRTQRSLQGKASAYRTLREPRAPPMGHSAGILGSAHGSAHGSVHVQLVWRMTRHMVHVSGTSRRRRPCRSGSEAAPFHLSQGVKKREKPHAACGADSGSRVSAVMQRSGAGGAVRARWR